MDTTMDTSDNIARANLPPSLRNLTDQQLAAMDGLFRQQQQSIQAEQSQNATHEAISVPQVKVRKHLADPEPFDGSNESGYRAFETSLKAKLHIDGAYIGGRTNQVYYCFTRLSGKAASMMQPWMARHENDTTIFTVGNFIDQLRKAFQNPELERQAEEKLYNMRQGRATVIDYLADVDRTILEANALSYADSSKISCARRGLNQELKDVLVAVREPTTYPEWCRDIIHIAQKASTNKAQKSSGRYGPATDFSSRRPQPPPEVPESTTPMDWEPTVSQLRERRAKWVDEREIAKRRRENRCIRCGSSDHYLKNCIFKPARRPGGRDPRVNNIGKLLEEAALEDEERGESEKA